MIPEWAPELPIPSRMNVTVSSRNSSCRARGDANVQRNSMPVKMPHIHRYRPSAASISFAGSCATLKLTRKKKEIQKAPNDENATAPNVLPVRNSHIPANSWAKPPNARAMPRTIGKVAGPPPTMLALTKLNTRVVRPKPERPSGAGFAGSQPAPPVMLDAPACRPDASPSSLTVANFAPLLRELVTYVTLVLRVACSCTNLRTVEAPRRTV